MSTTVERPAELDIALSSLLGGAQIPDQVSSSWVARVFGVNVRSVHAAINAGKLPAQEVRSPEGKVIAFIIKPGDAMLIWGHRLLKPKNEEA